MFSILGTGAQALAQQRMLERDMELQKKFSGRLYRDFPPLEIRGKPQPVSCPGCGAPGLRYHSCEYCGNHL